MGARAAALTALEKCRRSGAWSDAVLGSVMDKAGLDGRDRGMATALCYGVMQDVYLLDYYIGYYSRVKPAKMEPKVLDILRISAYQLLFMDRIPASAAVNEGVKLCRRLGYARAAGLVNAVLRRIAENRGQLLPVEAESEEERLSIAYSCPRWLVESYRQQLGPEEAEALLRCQNEPVPVSVQVNTCRIQTAELRRQLQESGVRAEAHAYLPDCLELFHSGELSKLPAFQEGLFYVQDAAARMAVMAASPRAGERVLDVCAAPGGKSFAAAVASGGQAQITSCDIHENKLKRIREGALRLGFSHLSAVQADGRSYRPEWDSAFDLVLADVPCSGLGVIRKKPDIRYKQAEEFENFAAIQTAILQNAARYVKPGGRLLYSTCTVRREENQAVAEAFLAEQPLFAAEDFSLPGGHASRNGMLQLWPHRDGTDGFFMAKFRRNQ